MTNFIFNFYKSSLWYLGSYFSSCPVIRPSSSTRAWEHIASRSKRHCLLLSIVSTWLLLLLLLFGVSIESGWKNGQRSSKWNKKTWLVWPLLLRREFPKVLFDVLRTLKYTIKVTEEVTSSQNDCFQSINIFRHFSFSLFPSSANAAALKATLR